VTFRNRYQRQLDYVGVVIGVVAFWSLVALIAWSIVTALGRL